MPPRTVRGRAAAAASGLLSAAALALLVAACDGTAGRGAAAPVAPPLPTRIDRLDPEVVALLEECAVAVRAEPQRGVTWLRLGLAHEAHELFPEAERCYARAVELDPAQPKWWHRLARVRARGGALEGALEAEARVRALAPGYAPAALHSGLWLKQLGRYDEALAALAEARRLAPEDDGARVASAQVLLDRGDARAAAELLGADPAAARGPNAAFAQQVLGTALARLGREAEAERATARGRGAVARFADPWSDEVRAFQRGRPARLREAQRLLGEERVDEALALLEALRERAPDDAEVHHKLGAAYAKAGRAEEMLASLQRAVELAPDDASARVSLAWGLALRGAHDEGLAQLERALAIAPGLALAHETKARLLLDAGRAEEALAAWAAGVPQGARDPVLRTDLAKAALELGRDEEARAGFELAARQDPALADAWVGLAVSELRLCDAAAARLALERAAALEPQHALLPELRAALAQAHASPAADE